MKKKIEKFKEVIENMEFKECDFVIVAIPAPITKDKRPDLSCLESASKIVRRNLRKGATVVY